MNTHDSSGFTVIEVVVTLVVTAVFLALFFQGYLLSESQRVTVARQAAASDIADTNLRKFAVRPTITPCVASMDLTTTPAGTGLVIGDETGTIVAYGFVAEPSSATAELGSNVHQVVKAFAPRGCGVDYATSPIKIQSTVTYGTKSPQEGVTHANYTN